MAASLHVIQNHPPIGHYNIYAVEKVPLNKLSNRPTEIFPQLSVLFRNFIMEHTKSLLPDSIHCLLKWVCNFITRYPEIHFNMVLSWYYYDIPSHIFSKNFLHENTQTISCFTCGCYKHLSLYAFNMVTIIENDFVAMFLQKCFVVEMKDTKFILWLVCRSSMLQTRVHLISSSQLLCCIGYCLSCHLVY
jgi:hypothetical protein